MAPRATKPGPAASSSARERDATGHSAKPNAGAAGFGLALLLAALALAVFAAPAQATIFGPRAGHSPNADDIRTAYWVAITIAALLVIAVHVFLIAAIFRFRARRGRAPQRFAAAPGALTRPTVPLAVVAAVGVLRPFVRSRRVAMERLADPLEDERLSLLRALKDLEGRSEERRVGKECSSPCRSRWSPDH